MKFPSLLIPGLCLLLVSFSTVAQDFEVPDNVTLEKKEDYVKYEKDVINAAKWLEATQVGKETDKRKNINGFIIQWISGSPTVNVSLTKFVQKLSDKNPQFLAMYMAGAARYSLENNYSADEIKILTAATKAVINLNNLGGDVKKNKFLQKAIDADKEGKLEDWVKENKDSK